MKDPKKIKWLNLRLTEDEFKSFKKLQQKTIFKKMSDYGRAVLLSKPITIFYRDKSMDDAMEELSSLKRELGAIGNNLNQITRRINTIKDGEAHTAFAEVSSLIVKNLEPKLIEIKTRMNNFSDVWSQKLNMGKA